VFDSWKTPVVKLAYKMPISSELLQNLDLASCSRERSLKNGFGCRVGHKAGASIGHGDSKLPA